MARGPKKHMKRLNAPKHWMLDKLGGTWVRSATRRADSAAHARPTPARLAAAREAAGKNSGSRMAAVTLSAGVAVIVQLLIASLLVVLPLLACRPPHRPPLSALIVFFCSV
jgi:hypothetical protein